MKTSKQYRVESKAALKGNWGMAILVLILYGLIFGVATSTLVGGILLSGALAVGLAYTFAMLFRRGKLELNDLFAGFNGNFAATIGLGIKTAIFTFLWSLLFIVPGIIASFSYSMAPYILADNPNMTGGEAIKASKLMMKGKKGKLFCLEFSFIGWLLLSVLTLGILMLWISPWMEAAKADFYETNKNPIPVPNVY